jgi:hypothetical protein
MDLQRGRIDQIAQQNFDLGFAITDKFESLAYALLTATNERLLVRELARMVNAEIRAWRDLVRRVKR